LFLLRPIGTAIHYAAGVTQAPIEVEVYENFDLIMSSR
jgi:hypothetical protein